VSELAATRLDRRLPPIEWISVLSMALAIVATIYLAWNLPHRPMLGPAIGLLAVAGALFAVDLALLARIEDFAWRTFLVVGRWSLLAYVVIAGMLEYIFIYDDTPAAILTLMTISLTMFTLNVVLILAFSVARFQPR
jgi:hypothetical protein